jgi:hypothetical protein
MPSRDNTPQWFVGPKGPTARLEMAIHGVTGMYEGRSFITVELYKDWAPIGEVRYSQNTN